MSKDFIVSKELQKQYLERKRNEIVEIEIALLKSDFETIESFGHKIKGNGVSYGFDILSELGTLLEIAAKEKDLDKTQDLFKRVKDFLDKTI